MAYANPSTAESRDGVTLASALDLLAPLVELLLREGVTYPSFAKALKATFLEAAEAILLADDARASDSTISTLSGIHRKDVRAWRAEGFSSHRSGNLGPVMEIYTRWASDPAYCSRPGAPRTLKRSGEAGSFDELAKSVSKDVHPRALLDEMLRLGVVRPAPSGDGDERFELCADAFVPAEGRTEMMQLFADNVGDHIAAAANNLKGGTPMLEQSVYADGLRPESAEALGRKAREIWTRAFREMATEAARLCDRDQGHPEAEHRIRFGVYFFEGSDRQPPRGD